VKVRLSLCLTKYYAMKTWRSGGIAPRITNLGISYRSVVSFTSQPLFTPGERVPDTHWIGGWVSPKAGLDGMTNFFFNIWRILLCFIWHKCDNNVIIIITTGSRQIRLGEAETKSRWYWYKTLFFFRLFNAWNYNLPCCEVKSACYLYSVAHVSMLGGSLVTMAWRVLRLRMEGSPPAMEGSCEYIE